MMTAASLETGFLPRLGRLKGIDGACCVPEYLGKAKDAVRGPRFKTALRRARAFADPKRLTVLALLRRSPELCGCELQAALSVSHATVSHHMRQLETAGLVRSERRGKWLYYRLTEVRGVELP
jgi:ArsR family transcriptional regulator